MSCSAELSTEHLDIFESLMLSTSLNLFTLIKLLFLFTRLKHKTKCLCENIFKNFHANSWQPLKKVAFSWHLNYKSQETIFLAFILLQKLSREHSKVFPSIIFMKSSSERILIPSSLALRFFDELLLMSLLTK